MSCYLPNSLSKLTFIAFNISSLRIAVFFIKTVPILDRSNIFYFVKNIIGKHILYKAICFIELSRVQTIANLSLNLGKGA